MDNAHVKNWTFLYKVDCLIKYIRFLKIVQDYLYYALDYFTRN